MASPRGRLGVASPAGLLQHVHQPPAVRLVGVLEHQGVRAEDRRAAVRGRPGQRLGDGLVRLPGGRDLLSCEFGHF